MPEERTTEKQRVRANVSTTAKGKAQFDVTVEVIDDCIDNLKPLLENSLAIAKQVAKEAGFEPAE